jgi:hypothetical protein
MLATSPAVRRPNPVDPDVGPQVINMPVRSLRHLLMVRDAGPQASWPQGAADVNVIASTQPKYAESPNSDQLIPGTKED